jgi:hypothetical protein
MWKVRQKVAVALLCGCHFVYSEAGVLKKLSLAGLAKLSRLRFGLASAGYHGLGVHVRTADTADSTEHYEIPGVSPLSLAEWG